MCAASRARFILAIRPRNCRTPALAAREGDCWAARVWGGVKGLFYQPQADRSNSSNLQMQLSEVAREKRGEEPTARKAEREKEKNS